MIVLINVKVLQRVQQKFSLRKKKTGHEVYKRPSTLSSNFSHFPNSPHESQKFAKNTIINISANGDLAQQKHEVQNNLYIDQ